MKNRRQIEREFGVPIAGEILEPSAWTQTALKKLPRDSPLDLIGIFGRRAPLIVDLGCGNGRFLIGSAVWRADHDHLGIDILPLVLRYATRRANQRGLHNLRFAAVDAQTLIQTLLPPQSAREIHCYHPQPHHNPADADKRLLRPSFLAQLHRALSPQGLFFVQTDNRAYWEYLRSIVSAFFDFEELPGKWPDAPKGRTRREILDLRRGVPVYRGQGRAADLPEEEVARRAESMPPPHFDAGPRLRELDELEKD
jgi:tRNA (guanine-N7-)-methyltransferase